jgi:hypothetical protein
VEILLTTFSIQNPSTLDDSHDDVASPRAMLARDGGWVAISRLSRLRGHRDRHGRVVRVAAAAAVRGSAGEITRSQARVFLRLSFGNRFQF